MANFFGGPEPDTLEGGSGADSVSGGAGNDLLIGNAGDDTIAGGKGDDTIFAGSGNDVILEGNTVKDFKLGRGSDSINGGDGVDLLAYDLGPDADSGPGLTIVFAAGYARMTVREAGVAVTNIDRFANIEAIIGTDLDDTFIASTETASFFGGQGSDRIFWGGAAGVYHGGDIGNIGNDFDLIDLSMAQGSVTVDGTGRVRIDGRDDVEFIGFEAFVGSATAANTLIGAAGEDAIFGTTTLTGGAVGDVIFSGISDARIDAKGGDDRIVSLRGAATIDAGAGNDTIIVSGDASVTAGDGDDVIAVRSGVADIYGGLGNDRITMQGGGGDLIVLGAGDDLLIARGPIGLDLYGGPGRDTLVLQPGEDKNFVTLFGIERLVATEENDSLRIANTEGLVVRTGGRFDRVEMLTPGGVVFGGADADDLDGLTGPGFTGTMAMTG
ncbi:MAG: calcium-binding protein [Pseudomonadota bacterium]